MKVKINIELFDDNPVSVIEELGVTTKFIKIAYEKLFNDMIDEIAVDGLKRTLLVEVEDNTVK